MSIPHTSTPKSMEEREDAEACRKLWDIYVKEAQQYDEGLIRSWKEDMDITLVFSGLYSAILTAFVIESYQNLRPDSAEDAATLLRRISQQLSQPSNSSNLTPFPDETTFIPTPSALACNVLWFVSLALALSCAFLATLVQQWSRRFLHRTSTVRSPGTRAHLLRFLYCGLKDLKMQDIVDFIPFLLHLSLFSFFSGLIGFLHDVNRVLACIFAVVLGALLLIYSVFTIMPIVTLSSPYSTPLSPLLWRILRVVRGTSVSRVIRIFDSLRGRQRSLKTYPCGNDAMSSTQVGDEEAQFNTPKEDGPLVNLTESGASARPSVPYLSIGDATIRKSQKRNHTREAQCIAWTLRTLNDDVELLSFVEALPDALLGGNLDRVREGNLHLVQILLGSEKTQPDIITKTLILMEDAKNIWHTNEHRVRCRIACARTFYAVGRILVDEKAGAVASSLEALEAMFSSNEMIRRLEVGIQSDALDKTFSDSIFALYQLYRVRVIRNRVQNHTEDKIHLSMIKAALIRNKSFPSNLNPFPDDGSVPPTFCTRQQAISLLQNVISNCLKDYLSGAVRQPSFNLIHNCSLLVQNGGTLNRTTSRYPLFLITDSLKEVRTVKSEDLTRMDTVIGLVMDLLAGYEAGDETYGLAEEEFSWYIKQRFRIGGWGASGQIWKKPGRLRTFLGVLKGHLDRFGKLQVSSSTIQELLLHFTHRDHVADELLFSNWETIFAHLQSRYTTQHGRRSYLWYMLAILAFTRSERQNRRDETLIPMNQQICSVVERQLRTEETTNEIMGEVSPVWKILLLCLRNRLPLLQIRDIWQYYFHCCAEFNLSPWIDHGKMVTLESEFAKELIAQSTAFGELLLKTPSRELLDINAMIYCMWTMLFPSKDSLKLEVQKSSTWHKLVPLVPIIESARSTEFRQRMDYILAESMQSSSEHLAAFAQAKEKWDHLNFFRHTEVVQKKLASSWVRHLLVALPNVTQDEAEALAEPVLDDDWRVPRLHHT